MDCIDEILPSGSKIKERINRNRNEVDLVVESDSEMKILKIFNVSKIKEKRMLKFIETHSFLSECTLPFIYPSRMYEMSNMMMLYERSYYGCDLKELVYSKCLSLNEICSIMIELSNELMILSEYDIVVSNIKSSNILMNENSNAKLMLCDLCLNEMRNNEEMRMCEICYRSPEDVNGNDYNEKSVIWSIGCILCEMLSKRLPFNEDEDMNKTKNNIMRCKLSDDVNVNDDEMKEILFGMLRVRCEDRLSLCEFNKEMIKEIEMMKDSENNLMMNVERKELIYKNRCLIYSNEYYLKSNKWEKIRDDLIEYYNNKPNERELSILLMMKLYKEDYSIKEKLKFQLNHHCEEVKECYLDKMAFYIENSKGIIKINSYCICLCEEGINYFFRILKLINPTKIKLSFRIPIHSQSLIGLSFSQLSNLRELNLWGCNISSRSIDSFIQSISLMNKLKYIIQSVWFKMLLPYLYLLIDECDEMNLRWMNLDDESIMLLSSELYKYPNLKKIDIRNNKIVDKNMIKSLITITTEIS